MKSRIDKIIFKFLDLKYGVLEQKKGKYFDIIFIFPGEKYGELEWKKSGDLYVFYKISDEISNYFGMETIDSLRIIGEWVEDRYNLKVTNTLILYLKNKLHLLKIDPPSN
jgi:hypothetical protein